MNVLALKSQSNKMAVVPKADRDGEKLGGSSLPNVQALWRAISQFLNFKPIAAICFSNRTPRFSFQRT